MDATDATAADLGFMDRAIELAVRGWGRVAPNPLVGAVVVRDGRIVGEGWHAEYGGPHAEVNALVAAGSGAHGGTLYVTLEPCSHHGKTPPCTQAILAAGVTRVVFASADPNAAAAGGAEILRSYGVQAIGGVREAEARQVNLPFFRAHDAERGHFPWTELKLAVSIDSRIADREGNSKWITGRLAREEVHRLRTGADAVAVGIGTVLADDPTLTARGVTPPRVPPVRVVFDRMLRLPHGSRLLDSLNEAPLWIVCGSAAAQATRDELRARGAELIEADFLADALRSLRQRGVRSLLCEGGAGLSSSLLAADLVDRLTLVIAPIILGGDAVDPFREIPGHPLMHASRWRPTRRMVLDEDQLLSFDR